MPALQPEPETPRFGTPREIREALLPEEVDDFNRQYRAALATAADTFDLAELATCLEQWRRIALSTSVDPEAHRRMLRNAQVLRDGGRIPAVPWSEARRRLGI